MLENKFIQGKIVEKKQLTDVIMKMTFDVVECNFSAPGQYATIRVIDSNLEGDYNMSEYDSERFTIVYKIDDDASKELALLDVGDDVEIMTGLGNGYSVDDIPTGVSLVADTMGIPQMLCLVRALLVQGKECRLILGFESKDKIFMIDYFREICNNIDILTADGTNGRQGRADDGLTSADYVCASGRIEMLDRLSKKAKSGQFNVDGTNVIKF